ncbi:hypothetical protein JVU11DRAFT_10507 [Chiua virens]|nr:hypothetical protein JVU11DRAFT_10507 [Chiua virens]
MGSKPMVALPALIYLATVGASLAWLTVSAAPGAVYSTQTVQIAGIASFSCSVAMNVTASILITIRLLMHRRAISQAVGSQQGRFYLSYLAMTLESAVLYTVFVIITLIVFTINSPLVNIFFPVLGTIQVTAPSLIIYRIGRGISFETDRYGKDSTEGTLRFASGPLRRQIGRMPGHEFSDASKTMQLSSDGSTMSKRDGSDSFTNELKHEQV